MWDEGEEKQRKYIVEVKEAVSRIKDAHKAMYRNSTVDNMMYKNMKNKAKTAVSKVIR